ncbi:MAG: hypothetical protein DIU78_012860 [Pseudomonadota bacterium]
MSQETSVSARIAQLQAEHGSLAHFVVGGQLFAFRKPTLEEWEDFQDSVSTGRKKRGVAYRELAMRCLVEPGDLDALAALFERNPGFNARIGDALSDLAGADLEVTVKKG